MSEALRKLGLEPDQAVLTRSRFVSGGLDAACETVLILPAEALRRLSSPVSLEPLVP